MTRSQSPHLVPALWYVGVWTALVITWALQIAPGLSAGGRIPWGHAFALAAINFYSTAVVAIPLTIVAWRRGIERHHVARSLFLYTAIIAAASVVRFVLFIPLLALVTGSHYTLGYELRYAFVPQFVGLATLLAVVLAVRSVQLSRELADARLAALQSQLQPHFLFNTLNAVSTLMHTDPAAADEMLAGLCDLLRHTLRGSQRPVVSLDEELMVASHYIDIMKHRFPRRIRVVVDVPFDLRQTPVPSMMLQPLLENVFAHAMDEPNRTSEVSIRAERIKDRVRLMITDNGPGLQSAPDARKGIGVDNTRRRLEAAFGPAARLVLQNAGTGGAEVTIEIPAAVPA
ncbi:MAG TPA: histidine kinase [Candidatus Aquilonibacter sp.]|nr:histidine kinase [Candidatus Aquilonibacter sp.]